MAESWDRAAGAGSKQEEADMKCKHCGQQIRAKDGHWQALSGYERLYCPQSPSSWHEPERQT